MPRRFRNVPSRRCRATLALETGDNRLDFEYMETHDFMGPHLFKLSLIKRQNNLILKNFARTLNRVAVILNCGFNHNL